MREIDTEAQVVWPAWCYSGNSDDSTLNGIGRKGEIDSDILSEIGTSSTATTATTAATTTGALTKLKSTDIHENNNLFNHYNPGKSKNFHFKRQKLTTKDSTTTTTATSTAALATAVVTAAFAEAVVKNELSHFQQQQQKHHQQQQGIVQSLPPSFVLNKFLSSSSSSSSSLSSSDKMLSDRMLIGFNVVDNNKKHCDNSTTNLLLDKIKNEVQMDTAKNGELGNNNNNNNNNSNKNNNNNNSNNSNNNNSGSSGSGGGGGNGGGGVNNNSNSISSNNNNSGSNNNNNNSSIKRERLSPPTNGDVQSSISRSRSATPSSFPGTPPQPINPNESAGQNLSASLLSSVQARSNEFQARNYSDFMRSLAAKYNNPNDPNTQRSLLFDTAKFTSAAKVSNKESPSPPDIKRPNLSNLTPPQVSSNPFVSSLLSSLPFSPAVFPPLIDMSSTQALVTLARAAKEAEIQNILRTAQKRPPTLLRSSTSPSSTSRANLTPTPQPQQPPPTQFSPQPFILPTQFHHQLPPQSSLLQPRQSSSPMSSTGSTSQNDFSATSPLDLSSTPQLKRIKMEKVGGGRRRSPSCSPTRDSIVASSSTSSSSALASHGPMSLKIESKVVGGSNGSDGDGAIESGISSNKGGGASGRNGSGSAHEMDSKILTTTATSTVPAPALSIRQCQAQSDEINSWTVDDVCNFVGSIDICAEYVKNFRNQCIDGSGLPLLTEEHLTNSLGMKLGPALKLRSILAKKLGGPCPCVACTTTLSHQSHLHSTGASTAIASVPSTTTNLSLTTASASSSSSLSISSISSTSLGNLTHQANSTASANQLLLMPSSSSIFNSSNNINNNNSSNISNIPRPASADSGS